QHAFRKDETAFLGLGLKDLEDQLLLAQPGGPADSEVLGDLVEFLDAHVLELDQIEGGRTVLLRSALPRLVTAALLLRRSAFRPLGRGDNIALRDDSGLALRLRLRPVAILAFVFLCFFRGVRGLIGLLGASFAAFHFLLGFSGLISGRLIFGFRRRRRYRLP